MAHGDKENNYCLQMYMGWMFCSIDAIGYYRGLVALWDPRVVKFWAFKTFDGIFLTSFARGYMHRLHILNVYAPYESRLGFWHWLDRCRLLKIDSIILVGDLNLTMVVNEL